MSFKESISPVLFESIQECLIVVNNQGIIVLTNGVCGKMFGYEQSELIGQKIELLVPSAARENHVGYRNDYHKKPKNRSMGSNMKLNGQHKNGKLIPVEVSLNPMKSNNEKYVIALVSDVTLRRRAEEELVQFTQNLEQIVAERTKELWKSEQLYKSIARNFPGGLISIFDASFKYLFAEGQGLYELGIETEDLIGQDYIERIAPTARKKVKSELEKVFKGESASFEVNVNQGVYYINAVPLTNVDNEIDRILVVEKNITAQKEAAKRLEENLKAEKELNEMKSRFVSMASHEFRTPLTTINSSAGLILKHNEKGNYHQTAKHVERIKNSVRNLTSILNDFLSLEKLESGKIQVNTTTINLKNFINEVLEEMEGLKKDNQSFIYKIPEENIKIDSDSTMLKNILINLISNAVKYSKEDGEIIISTTKEGKDLKIDIEDFGIGIPKSDQNKMFERFFRAGNATNIEGTGLGLHIVIKYLEILNGKLDFISEENKGTTFTVTLKEVF